MLIYIGSRSLLCALSPSVVGTVVQAAQTVSEMCIVCAVREIEWYEMVIMIETYRDITYCI